MGLWKKIKKWKPGKTIAKVASPVLKVASAGVLAIPGIGGAVGGIVAAIKNLGKTAAETPTPGESLAAASERAGQQQAVGGLLSRYWYAIPIFGWLGLKFFGKRRW